MFDLHRHDEFSTFDGFGKATELAKLAKSYGYKSLCTTNHGNTNGLIRTWQACKDEEIKAILGCEGYFLPKFKEKTRGYHMILIAKNLVGYGNLNRIQFYSEDRGHKYYNPIWDFDILEQYHEGLICTTACVASYTSQCIIKDKPEMARKALQRLQKIFGDDLYIEIQPYVISDPGVQEKVNLGMIELGEELGIKLILTSDSHRGAKEDMPTYIKMHEVAGHNIEHIEDTYSERYMPRPDEMRKRFYKMHHKDLGNERTKKLAMEMYKNLDEIEEKCEDNYLEQLPLNLPKLGENSSKILVQKVKEGLKRRGKYNKKYIERCKEELDVIKFHHFEDYFLIVADYTLWAKENGIHVGPGRGSVCNCLVAYCLGITEVDSILFGLDFRRFLRKDKKKFPDIDLDFETSRRHEVIEYLCTKYKGHAARVASYGLYKVDNLINDLAKVCGLPTQGDVDEEEKKRNKEEIAAIKKLVNDHKIITEVDLDALMQDDRTPIYDKRFDGIITHFCKLYQKMRFMGTHAAGVAITGGDLLDYCALRKDKSGDIYTCYDLSDLEAVHVIKFDILGLKTMESIGDLQASTGVKVDYDKVVYDEKLLEKLREGDVQGIFQFDKQAAIDLLTSLNPTSFQDVVAASAMNRPGPLSLHMPEIYAATKAGEMEVDKSLPYWKYIEDTYGCVIYQEQIMLIATQIGGLDWPEADKITKMTKTGTDWAVNNFKTNYGPFLEKFTEGAKKHGMTAEQAKEIFDTFFNYSFNKGHATGYSLITMEELFYKVYYPNEYWFAKLKYARDDSQYGKFSSMAVADGSVIFLPHVNYSSPRTTLRKMEGEHVIQQGLSDLKNVGEKASSFIYEERMKNGIFRNFDDFYDRCKSRTVTSRVISTLQEAGALEFNKKTYISRVKKYNTSLYAKNS